jgi:hypothetical protein
VTFISRDLGYGFERFANHREPAPHGFCTERRVAAMRARVITGV